MDVEHRHGKGVQKIFVHHAHEAGEEHDPRSMLAEDADRAPLGFGSQTRPLRSGIEDDVGNGAPSRFLARAGLGTIGDQYGDLAAQTTRARSVRERGEVGASPGRQNADSDRSGSRHG